MNVNQAIEVSLFFGVILTTIRYLNAELPLLFVVSQKNKLNEAGVFGGHVDFRQNGQINDIFRYGYQCLSFSNDQIDRIIINSIAYDPVSGRILLNIKTDDTQMTVVTARVCEALTKCSNRTLDVILLKAPTNSQLKVGPFGYYDSNVFFILEKSDSVSQPITIQLRQMSRCKDPFVTVTGVRDFPDCSILLSTIIDEMPRNSSTVRPLSNLLVLSLQSGYLDFYVMIQNTYQVRGASEPSAESTVTLYHIRRPSSTSATSDSGPANPVHQVSISHEYVKYLLYQTGGISYMDGTLCWSTVNRVFCAAVNSDGTLKSPRPYLETGLSRSVCNVDQETDIRPDVITGVALVDVHDEMAFYFGCIAQTPRSGGGGLFRMPKSGNSQPKIYPMRIDSKDLFAESMFASKTCSAPGQHQIVINFLYLLVLLGVALCC